MVVLGLERDPLLETEDTSWSLSHNRAHSTVTNTPTGLSVRLYSVSQYYNHSLSQSKGAKHTLCVALSRTHTNTHKHSLSLSLTHTHKHTDKHAHRHTLLSKHVNALHSVLFMTMLRAFALCRADSPRRSITETLIPGYHQGFHGDRKSVV